MNFGSSALHVVVEPATDCCRYVGVEYTIEQFFYGPHCRMQLSDQARRALFGEPAFSREAGCNVGGDRRQCSAFRVFRPRAMLRRVERDVHQVFSSALAAGNSRLLTVDN